MPFCFQILNINNFLFTEHGAGPADGEITGEVNSFQFLSKLSVEALMFFDQSR